MRCLGKSSNSGLSLIDVTIAIGLISIVCGLALSFGNNLRNVASHTKLEQDVKVINSAAKLFLSNGGSFEGIQNPQQILDRMKSAQAAAQRSSFVGMTGATIDKRTIAVPIKERKAKFAAVWDPSSNQFLIVNDTEAGISRFDLDESLASVEYAEIARNPSLLAYNDQPGWIWKYEERPPTFAGGPSEIPVGSPTDTPPPTSIVNLLAPRIILSEPSFNSSTPEITVTLSNPNPAGSSEIYYSLIPNGESHPPPSTWGLYSGPIITEAASYPGGFEVATFAKSIDPSYLDSDFVDAATSSEFFGIPITGNVVFVVDASRSMRNTFGSKTRFETTIDELVSAIQSLSGDVEFNVAMFDNGVHWTDGSNKLHPANKENKQDMISKVQSVKTGGGTNYSAALSLPLNYSPYPEQVIFLSDGQPNNPNFLDELTTLTNLGIRVNTVGLDTNSTAIAVLKLIADQTGGIPVVIE